MDKMGKLFILFVLAVITNEAVGLSYRHRRQTNDGDGDNSLEDRYGWERPRPWQPPNQQRPRPNQGGNQQWPLPNQGGNQQWPFPNQGGQQTQPTQRPNGNGSTSTTLAPTVDACIRACPATPEYNPVCGTNGVTYNNPGRLTCAQQCGVSVSVVRLSPCPVTTTAAPS